MIGSLNPCPFRVGGGPTASSKAYTTIRRAVGEGGSAPDDRGIDGVWRRSRAKGLAAATNAKRRALLQAFPHLATDALPYYERILGLLSVGAEAERRDVVVPLWTRRPLKSTDELETSLQAIDARFSLVTTSREQSTTTQHGRAFAPLHPALESPAFGLNGFSLLPNYSSGFQVFVLFDVGHAGNVTAQEARLLEQARELLRSALPSWVDLAISTTSGGFHLDIDALDLTGMT